MKSLFLAVWATFVMLAAPVVAQGANYTVKPGDTLRIEVLEDATLNRSVVVLPDGRFSFPFLGTAPAAGRTLGQIEQEVANGIASNFATKPNVFVSVQSLTPEVVTAPGAATAAPSNAINIYFLGEVAQPGLHPVAPGTTLLQALSVAGGFSNFAATKRVQLRRGAQLYTVNYKALLNGAQMNDIVLRAGDVIMVPERRLFE